jgi:glycosyltransferase involved in cell wall biosynthesis
VKAIGINAHLLSGEAGYRRAGIHQYIAQILANLPRSGGDLHYTLFTRFRPSWRRPDLRLVSTAWPTEKRWARILWEQIAWPLAAARRRLDLLHSMAFVTPLWAPCPTVVTVYDLSFLYYPSRFPRLQRLYLTTQTRRSCRAARRIVTISESGRQDVHRFFAVPLDKIDVVPPGVDPTFRPLPPEQVAAFRHNRNLPERFVLHVGTLQPRKEIPVLLEAMARLRRAELPLILVGGKGWMYDEIFARVEELGLHEQVRFTGYVPDEELPLWYNAATLLALPSVYEGFGMPAVQALACGTPVVAADTSALPEAVGDAGLLFPAGNVEALVNRMLVVLDNAERVVTMRQRGFAHVKHFSWAHSGAKMAEVYRHALAEPDSTI